MNPGFALSRRIQKTAAMLVVACTLTVLGVASSFAQNNPTSSAVTPDEAAKIATDAYIYGYPLVTMEYTRRVLTNVAEPSAFERADGATGEGAQPTERRFSRPSRLRTRILSIRMVWLDLSKEPYVLSLPDAHGRYYLFPMLDAWTTVFQVPGKRTTGTGPQTYAITGPGWSGTLPAGVTEYKSPTALVWILGRIYCTGTPTDYTAVHKMQDEISVGPA